jgi:hypothetical protein
MSAAPGWYADPQTPGFLRWWNGGAWTEHTSAATQAPQPQASQPLQPTLAQPTNASAFPGKAALVSATPSNTSNVAPARQDVPSETRAAEEKLAALRRELESVEEALEIQSFGFYRPRYGFETSAEYVARLKEVRDQQKDLIKANTAWHCDTEWLVGGSKAEGRKMVQRLAKLMLRAFNGECDASIAKTRYDNVLTLQERILKSYEAINKLGHSNQVTITAPYHSLKIAELRLVHEHREKVQAEKEEQRRIRDALREEEKARAEIERAQARAEAEEAEHQKALDKARADLAAATATDKQHAKLEGLIAKLETELADAIDRKAKAIARAQLTRSGHVYVLSNIGSFGAGIYKIGLTRRLDPYQRVDELGDASVPFGFDVHAIIYSEDAPALEAALHREFAQRRVNLVNLRKEYFRVTLDEVGAALERHHGLVSLVLSAEAEEWRKTQAALAEPETESTETSEGSPLTVMAGGR